MLKDFDQTKEPASKRATRRWQNNALAKKAKEGKLPIPMLVDPDAIDYDNSKIHLSKNAPPEIGSFVPTTEAAERKVVRDRRRRALRQLFSFLYEDMERKKILIKSIRPQLNLIANDLMRRRLLLELLRRKEASIAQREREIARSNMESEK